MGFSWGVNREPRPMRSVPTPFAHIIEWVRAHRQRHPRRRRHD